MIENGIIRKQIDRYRFVYHRLEFLQGLLSFLALLVFSLSAFAAIEYFLFLKVEVKVVLFISWLLINLYSITFWVIFPLLAMTTGWRSISDRQVAVLMGNEDAEVEDKILNFLELEENSSIDSAYLYALISQKSKLLSNHNLLAGLNTKRVVKAAWIASMPTLVVLILSLFNGSLFVEGSQRFLNYNTAYVPSAPFSFNAEYSFQVEKGKGLELQVSVSGSKVPESVMLNLGDNQLPMRSMGGGIFVWKIERLTESVPFYFEALGFRSGMGSIEVLETPALLNFYLDVVPPSYTGIAPFTKDGTGDVLLPQGSRITWNMNWKDADELVLLSGDSVLENFSKQSESWVANQRISDDLKYNLKASNSNGTFFKSGKYEIEIVPDSRPLLEVEWNLDTLTGKVYVSGSSSDDYGISYTKVLVTGDSTYSLPTSGPSSNWTAVFQANSSVKSFKVVTADNDGINGSKTSVAGPYILTINSESDRNRELNAQDRERVDELRNFRERQEQSEELQNSLQQQMIDGASEWKNEQMRNRVLQSQQQLLQDWNRMMNQFRKENEERILSDPENELNAEKREELERLMQEMDKEKLEELLKELEEDSEDMDEDNMHDWLRRIQNENDRMERDAKRLEELMKRLAFEQELDQSMRELEDLQQRQQDLAERDDDTQAEQDELNADFEEWKNNLDSLEEHNQDLDRPMDFSPPSEEAESTQESMEQSSDELGEQNSEGANEKQQQSSESMQDLMQQMSSSVMAMSMQQHVENLANLRRILTNLIHLSESQEALNTDVFDVQATDATVVSWMKEQQDLRKSYEIVDDSLTALVGRIPFIKAAVTEWMVMVDDNMEASNESLSERALPRSTSEMRQSMLALNELSLMLDVTMDQIQQQMSSMMQGDQTCQKPGGGKPSMSNMRKRQQQLSQQMQQMGQQQGNGEPQNKPGRQEGQSGQGNGSMSQELVEMMARQAEIREMLKEAGSTGNNGDKSLDELLEENERDLLNRNFDTEFFERQKEIEVKMLELEEAERQQEQDEQRNSNSGNRYQELLKSREEEFLRNRREQYEQLRYEAPVLTPYYRQRSGSYLRGQ